MTTVLTVHHFSTVLSQDGLLSQAQKLVQNTGWRNTKWVPPSISKNTKYAYRFAYSPPIPDVGERMYQLEEWDSVVPQADIFSLSDLDDFVNTDLSSIFRHPLEPPAEKRERSADSASEPQSKRRKLETGALCGFIPKPHVYPSPFCPSLSPPKGKPFEKTEPIFIAPYLSFSLPDDARVAWLIPIRGILPWENCTSGVFLHPSHNIPTPITNDQISWTQDSILKFWEFLLRLRNVGKLGPLGISFHCSLQSRISPATTILLDPDLSLQETRCTLSMTDYIKVNHDAPCRLHVRSALDAWSYEVKDTHDAVKHIRLLKGSRLVLVDARSRGIQIS